MCALIAAFYAATDSVFTLDVSAGVLATMSRASLTLGGLHGAAWFRYYAAHRKRSLFRWERVMVVIALFFAVIAPFPGVLYSSEVHARDVAWLGVTYRDVVPTALGLACFAYYSVGLAIMVARYAFEWRSGVPYAGAHVVGIAALLVAGVNDALAAAGVIKTPYLIDYGFIALMISVGGALTSRFVQSARAFEEAAAQLEETQRELVRSERLAAIGELSAVVAHEVRNPVGVIFNALATLRRLPPGSPENEELLVIVQEEAERLKRMVADLLEFARPRDLHLDSVPLARMIAGAVEAAQRVNEAHGSAVGIEIDADTPVVRCDEQLVRQAVINLVTNALQAEGRRGPVRVIARGDGPRNVEIRVVDDGKGITPDVARRMFTPFFTTRPSGTGLGLAVVQRIAEAHGGEIAHEATPGGGATFVLRLPVVAALASERRMLSVRA